MSGAERSGHAAGGRVVRIDERFLQPAEIRARYYRDGHWQADDLWTTIASAMARRPQEIAFIEGERSITFGELLREAERFSAALQRHGVCAGEGVVIHGRHCLESLVAIVGCAHAGVVAALLPHMFSAEQIRGVLDNTEARTLIALGEAAEIARARDAIRGRALAAFAVLDAATGPPEPGEEPWSAFMSAGDAGAPPRVARHADDLVLLMFSSGTTGEPKGVMHSSNTVRFTVDAYGRYQDIVPGDVSLVLTAFGFIGSSVLGTYLTFLFGCRTVLQRSWNAADALALVQKHRVTHFLLMPTHAIDMLECPQLDATDCTSVTRGVVAGVGEAHRLDARRRLCARPYPMYGMSESPGHVTGTGTDDLEDLRTTEGRVLPATELRICDDDDRPLPAGSPGNILVRGPNRFLGYYRNDALNVASLTADGFFRTGDVGVVDARDFMTFMTRSKDIIRRGGVTITPADVEAALRPHPRIADVSVIPLPDPRLGERACACVITRDGRDITLQELTDFLAARAFARYQWPESVVLCTSFPRTPSLKVQKNELRAQVLARGTSGG